MSFKSKINHWNKLKGESQHAAAQEYYWAEMFPTIIRNVRARSQKQRKKYQCLISLVGFSPAPIILTIKTLEPEFVLFLHTKDTQNQLDVIVEKSGLKPSAYRPQPVSDSKTEDVYLAIKKLISEFPDQSIAVDITGGKKSMVGGAAIAGALTGCDIFYIDFSEYDKQGRQPVPGSEYLNFLSNPFVIFGDLEFEEGKQLFNKGNYYAAAHIFGELSEKIPQNEQAVFLQFLSQMFKEWDEYNFPAAQDACDNALKQAKRCHIYSKLWEALAEKSQLLERLKSGDATSLVLNHYFTSRRMAERGRYDFAALLLYRTLEMAFATHLISAFHFNVDDADYATLPDDIEQKYFNAGKSIYGKRYENEPLPRILGLMNAYQLLLGLDDPIIREENPKRILGIAQLRNRSILAHGTNSVSASVYQKILDCFFPYLQRFAEIYFENGKMESFEDMYGFLRF